MTTAYVQITLALPGQVLPDGQAAQFHVRLPVPEHMSQGELRSRLLNQGLAAIVEAALNTPLITVPSGLRLDF